MNVVQSVAVRPKSLGMAGLGVKTAAHVLQISFDQFTFAVGTGATDWGTAQGNMDYSAFSSPERRASFYAALIPLLQDEGACIDTLVVGLPVPLLLDERQAEPVLTGLKSSKGQHDFKVGETEYALHIDKLKVLPQPLGAYADWLLDEELRSRKNAGQVEAAILDIGMNTFDLYVVRGGQVAPRFVAGGKNGVRRLIEILNEDGRDLEEIDADLRSGKLKPPTTLLQSWLSELFSTVEKTMLRLSRFGVVIPAGGGAAILGDSLRFVLASRGAAIHWPSDPVGTNALGLWKWSAYAQSH